MQAALQIRFTSVSQVVKLKTILKTYIRQATEIEKAGVKVNSKRTVEFKTPEEFQNKLDPVPVLTKAFAALTPGRQRR